MGPKLTTQQEADIITYARRYGERKNLPEVLVGYDCIVTCKHYLGRVRLERYSATITWQESVKPRENELVRDVMQIKRDKETAEKK